MLKERTIETAVAEKKTDLNAIKTQNKHTEFACCYESENTNGAYTSDDKAQWEKGARGRGERRCFRPLVSTGVSGLRSIRGKDKAMQKRYYYKTIIAEESTDVEHLFGREGSVAHQPRKDNGTKETKLVKDAFHLGTEQKLHAVRNVLMHARDDMKGYIHIQL